MSAPLLASARLGGVSIDGTRVKNLAIALRNMVADETVVILLDLVEEVARRIEEDASKIADAVEILETAQRPAALGAAAGDVVADVHQLCRTAAMVDRALGDEGRKALQPDQRALISAHLDALADAFKGISARLVAVDELRS